MPSRRVIVDTSPLIALDRIGKLWVLPKLYGTLVRPRSVLDEILDGGSVHGASELLLNAAWLITEDDPREKAFRKELGSGETAAITLAYLTKANLIVLDDLAARLVAASLGLKVTGTLGVLSAAHHRGLIADLSIVLDDLQASGFRIAPELLDRLRSP